MVKNTIQEQYGLVFQKDLLEYSYLGGLKD